MIIDMQEAIKNKTAHPADTLADVKIAIKDLNLYYGAFHALHGINLDIERGKITAFIGPSGCGKSTLLKTLNRMNDLIPDCRVDGQHHAGRRGHLRQHGREPAAQARRHGVPEAEPLPHERLRQHCLRPAHAWHPPQGTAGRNCGKQPARTPPFGTS